MNTFGRSVLIVFFSLCSFQLASAQQTVFLDFDSNTTGGEHVYTVAERNQIQSEMEFDYGRFNFVFTQATPGAGFFSTLTMNAGPALGLADAIDFRNLDMGDNATINVNSGATTSAEFVTLTANVASHELGHLVGLRHGDSFGPLGSGIDPGTASGGSYLPTYNGPTDADETRFHIMESDSVFIEDSFNQFFSERSAIKLAFNENGKVVDEAAGGKGSLGTAQAIELGSLIVPNTIESGDRAGLGDLDVDAIVVTGSLDVNGEDDFYRFDGIAGDLFNLEVISNVLDRFADSIDSQVTVLDDLGTPIDYFGVDAFNDDELESTDSILLDFMLPTNGTYFVQVNGFNGTQSGDYELFIHRFNGFVSVPEPTSAGLLGAFVFGVLLSRRQRTRGSEA